MGRQIQAPKKEYFSQLVVQGKGGGPGGGLRGRSNTATPLKKGGSKQYLENNENMRIKGFPSSLLSGQMYKKIDLIK